MKTIVCLYGGAGTGKSTTAAALFAAAKRNGYNAEMNREYIKEWIWEGREIHPGDQTYIFAKGAKKERSYMMKGLNLIISDSPLILTHFYGMKHDKFEQEYNTSLQMLEQHHAISKSYGYKVEHIFLNRKKEYNPAGRFQTEEEAKVFDGQMKQMLSDMKIDFKSYDAIGTVENEILLHLIKKYD